MIDIAGSRTIQGSTAEELLALLGDGQEMAYIIPGCRSLEIVSHGCFRMDVEAGIGALRGIYSGTVQVSDGEVLQMKVNLTGPAATLDGEVNVELTTADGATNVSYTAAGNVVGTAAGVGQRVMKTAAQAVAGELFSNLEERLAQGKHATGVDGKPEYAASEAADGRAGPQTVYAGSPRTSTFMLPTQLPDNWPVIAVAIVIAFVLGRRSGCSTMRRSYG